LCVWGRLWGLSPVAGPKGPPEPRPDFGDLLDPSPGAFAEVVMRGSLWWILW
jgi:hypothetical protein